MPCQFSRKDWDRYAACYDSLNELHPYAHMLEDVLNALQHAGGPVLDAGCGTGNLSARLSQQNIGPIFGIDASVSMLDRAAKKCVGAEFLRADLDATLPFKDRTFGAVACVNALYALADPARTLREFSRVLRPQGSLIVVTPKLGYENGLILKCHCRSPKPDSYWKKAHETPQREELLIREAIRESRLIEDLLWIARFNRAIAHERSFHFFTSKELSYLARESGFIGVRVKKTYAGQNLLLVAERTHERKS